MFFVLFYFLDCFYFQSLLLFLLTIIRRFKFAYLFFQTDGSRCGFKIFQIGLHASNSPSMLYHYTWEVHLKFHAWTSKGSENTREPTWRNVHLHVHWYLQWCQWSCLSVFKNFGGVGKLGYRQAQSTAHTPDSSYLGSLSYPISGRVSLSHICCIKTTNIVFFAAVCSKYNQIWTEDSIHAMLIENNWIEVKIHLLWKFTLKIRFRETLPLMGNLKDPRCSESGVCVVDCACLYPSFPTPPKFLKTEHADTTVDIKTCRYGAFHHVAVRGCSLTPYSSMREISDALPNV